MSQIDIRQKRIITYIHGLAILTLSIVFFNCANSTLIMSDRDGQQTDINVPIGVVVALTGKHGEAYGFSMQRGFEMAREEINNHGDVNLTFITVDDQSTPAGAIEAVKHLVDQGVSAIVGLAISTHLKAVAPIAQEGKVIAFSSVSSAGRFEWNRRIYLPHKSCHKYKYS